MADAALLSAIQETLDQVDLKEMREVAKGNIDEEQKRQKKSFDAKRFKPPINISISDIYISDEW